jgi:hypothetical protein
VPVAKPVTTPTAPLAETNGKNIKKGNTGKNRTKTKTEITSPRSSASFGLPKKPNAIPAYRVTDDSKIEIVTVEDAKTESLVKNNFDNSSTEGKVTGGYGGVGVSASVGQSNDHQDGTGKTTKGFDRKMIGKYIVCYKTCSSKGYDGVQDSVTQLLA